jgi:hypothetical protein
MDRKSDFTDVALFIVVSILAFIFIGDIVGLVAHYSDHYEVAIAYPGTFLAAVGVFAVVRWINRRSKRPPDPP